MTNASRWLVTSLFLVAFLSFAGASSPAHAFGLKMGAGLKGGVNGAATSRVGEGQFLTGSRDLLDQASYYGGFGIGGAFGATIELRALDMVAFETGLMLSFDNVQQSWNDINAAGTGVTITRINREQATTAYHIPLLLKVNVPAPLVRPFLGLGVEFVLQSSSTHTYTESPRAAQVGSAGLDRLHHNNQLDTSNYTLFLLTTGLELKFGPVRVPVEIRAGYNLGFEDQVVVEDNRFRHNGAYQGHFGVFTGVIYDFDLLL